MKGTLMSDQPGTARITVGITCYREGDLLRRCWESVLTQTFKEWECIVINDASPDDATNHICASLKHPRLSVIHRSSNGGLSAARNDGVRASRAPIYFPLDADDALAPDALENVMRFCDVNPEVGVVQGDLEARYSDGHVEAWGGGQATLRESLIKQQIPSCSPFRKNVWESIGGYDLHLSWGNQDWDFWLSVFEGGYSGRYLAKTLVYYRVSQDSMSHSYGTRWPEIRRHMYRKHRAAYDKYRLGRAFIGKGDALASNAWMGKGFRMRGLSLALRGAILSTSWEPMGSALRSLLPRRVNKALSRLKARLTAW